MKTKLFKTRFGGNFGTVRFDERSFLNTLLSFTPYWDYKPTNAIHVDSPGIYTIHKILYLSTIYKIHLKCDVTDGSMANGIQNPILFSFVLDKPSEYRIFCEPEGIPFKKINNSVWNTIAFCLENDDQKEVDFVGETLTFTLKMIKSKIRTSFCLKL